MNSFIAVPGQISARDATLIRAVLDGLLPEVRSFIAGEVDRLVSENKALGLRLLELEKRAPERGERGEPGRDGQDGAAGRDGVDGQPGHDGADGAPGRDGQDGADGQAGRDGVDGQNGSDGQDGTPGRDGTDGRDGSSGRDGADGQDGRDGADGAPGRDGERGADGVGLAGALIDRAGALIVTLTDGSTRELGPVVGRDGRDGEAGEKGGDGRDGRDGTDGRDGRDGTDGLGFDDLTFEQAGDRGFVLRFVRGEQTKTFAFSLPVLIDRGVYRAGNTYQKGDCVTFGGSLWIAQADTEVKPDGPDTGWRLAVKKGRDGRDASTGA